VDTKYSKFLSIVAALFLAGFSFFIMKELQAILLPFFVALIISFLFAPFYEFLKRKKVPSFVGIIIIVLIILVIANISSVFVYTSIIAFKNDVPKYVEKSQMLINSMLVYFDNLGIPESYKQSMNITNFLNGEKIAGVITDLISGIAGIFTNFVLILIYVIFLLTEFGSIRRRVVKAFSAEKSRKITEALGDILFDVRKYIVGKTLINFSHALTITIVFWIFGLDFAILWGLLTFVLAYIPNIGAFIATILPFLTSLMQYDNFVTPIVLLIIMAVVGSVFRNIIEPKVLGDRLNLSPILLLFSLIFWGYVWGVVGMILSVPVMSMIKIVLSKFESTRPVAIMMSYEVSNKNDAHQTEMEFKE